MDAIAEIKERADIMSIVGAYTTLAKSGKAMKGLCPFHSEKHGSFFVYPDQQSWHCFGACATGGDVFSFVMKKEGITFAEALIILAERTGVKLPQRYLSSTQSEKNERLYQLNTAAAAYFHRLLLESDTAERSRQYLSKRGIDDKSIELFQLGYAPADWQSTRTYLLHAGYSDLELLEIGLASKNEESRVYDRFRNMIIFPIADGRGKITGFGARVLDGSLPKYINSPETPLFDKSSSLYALHLASQAIRDQDRVIIVEGYFDAIISHQYGFSNTVASMGTAINEKHISVIKRLTKNIILALDADAAGEEAVRRSVGFDEKLKSYKEIEGKSKIEIKVALAPTSKDPDEVIKDDPALWHVVLDAAQPILEFAFHQAEAGLDLRKTEDKTVLLERLLPIIMQTDEIGRGDYIVRLAQKINVPRSEIYMQMQKVKSSRGKKAIIDSLPKDILFTSPLEEYTLSLLLKVPELRAECPWLIADHFETSQHRLIFEACRSCTSTEEIRQKLGDSVITELDELFSRPMPENKLQERLEDCAIYLEERYLRRIVSKIEDARQSLNYGELPELDAQESAVCRRLGEIKTIRKSRNRH